VKLSESQITHLLETLCIELGFCLPPDVGKTLISNPPDTVDEFTQAVFPARYRRCFSKGVSIDKHAQWESFNVRHGGERVAEAVGCYHPRDCMIQTRIPSLDRRIC
jgi:hypothetical protein